MRKNSISLADSSVQLAPKIHSFRSFGLFMGYSNNEEAPDYSKSDLLWRYGPQTPTLEKFQQNLLSGHICGDIRNKANKISRHFEKIVLAELSNRRLLKKRSIVYREEGDELDLDRLYSGVPEHWKSHRPVLRPKQFIKVGICGLQDFRKTSDDFVKMGALACCLSGILAKMGFSIEILVSLVGRTPSVDTPGEWTPAGLVFPIKAATEVVDMAKIMSIRFPGLVRHNGFRALSQMGIPPHQLQTFQTPEEIANFCGLLNLDLFIPEDMPDLDDLEKSKPFYFKLTDDVINSVWGKSLAK